MTNPYTLHKLENGLRIVIERMPDVPSAAAGFLVNTGARDELAPSAGVSHFLEHMMFKGTRRRTWRDITIDFDRMGSVYNAYTSEEQTIYFGWVRTGDISSQIELLSDMIRSTLPDEEFNTEKKVILEEIAMSKDNLEHLAIDFLQEKIYPGHSLAWPILGYEQTVRDMTRDEMWEYFQKRYAPENMFLVVAGNVDPSHVIAVAEEHCGGWQQQGTLTERVRPSFQRGTDVLTVDRFNQQLVVLAFPSVGGGDERAEVAGAAATILGGENSRMYWNICQTGLSPRAGAYQMEYTDVGAMLLFGNCNPDAAEALHDAICKEAEHICTQRVDQHEVDRVKNKRRTTLAMEAEAPYHRLSQLIDDMQFRGAPRTVDQMLAEVDAITVDAVYEYFQKYPINDGGCLVSVGPRNWPCAS